MKIIRTVAELRELVAKTNLSPLGFVPTMGALHQGHLSLAENAVSKCPVVIVSIYVNPTQFNDREDLRNYPRPVERDLELLGSMLRQNDIVFTPDDGEMYPSEDKRVFSFGNLGKVMEALHRPGHFNGVAMVVSRFFDIIDPDMAFFGQKDFQQVAIIKELVRQKKYKVRIIVSPIIREADGLAISSRNMLLESEDRKLNFTDDSIREIAKIATEVNDQVENIGARRLHTILTNLLEDILFNVPDKNKRKVIEINKELVSKKLNSIVKNRDLSRYIL